MASPNDEPITATLDTMPEMSVVVGPYPVHHHDHPYSVAANRIHELEGKVRALQGQLDECHESLRNPPARGTGWHPYMECGDAPKVAEYQKGIYLCMVQRYAKDTGEEMGAVEYQVLSCDDNGLFCGLPHDGLVDYRVIAWTEIPGRDYEESALAYQRQGKL